MYMSSVHVYLPAVQLYKLSCCICQVYVYNFRVPSIGVHCQCTYICRMLMCIYRVYMFMSCQESICVYCGVYLYKLGYVCMPGV